MVEAHHVAHVVAIHAHNIVELIVVGGRCQARRTMLVGNAVPIEDFFRSVVNVAADFIAMHRCRLHVDGSIEPRLAHTLFHDEFSHR